MKSCRTTVLWFVRAIVVVALLPGLGACSGPTESGPAEAVTIDVGTTAVEYHASRAAVDASIPVTIRNAGPTRVFFERCGTALERAEGDEWQQVWFAVCSLGTQLPATEIAPGAQITTNVQVQATLGYGIADQWVEPVSGEYRIRVLLYDKRDVLPEVARMSRPFTLRAE